MNLKYSKAACTRIFILENHKLLRPNSHFDHLNVVEAQYSNSILFLQYLRSTVEMATMKAVVFHGAFDVKVEDAPIPVLQNDTDAIVKVRTAGLCGRQVLRREGRFINLIC